MIKNRTKVSKFLSFVLRHRPDKYGLHLDMYGFAELETILDILKKRFPGIERNDILTIIKNDSQMRFQVEGDKIRARYGHTVDTKPYQPIHSNTPDILFHGTSQKAFDSIVKEGLKSRRRKFVHLSQSVEDALRVGRRKDINPVVLKIDAKKLEEEGLISWKEGKVFLTREVPPKYISLHFFTKRLQK